MLHTLKLKYIHQQIYLCFSLCRLHLYSIPLFVHNEEGNQDDCKDNEDKDHHNNYGHITANIKELAESIEQAGVWKRAISWDPMEKPRIFLFQMKSVGKITRIQN